MSSHNFKCKLSKIYRRIASSFGYTIYPEECVCVVYTTTNKRIKIYIKREKKEQQRVKRAVHKSAQQKHRKRNQKTEKIFIKYKQCRLNCLHSSVKKIKNKKRNETKREETFLMLYTHRHVDLRIVAFFFSKCSTAHVCLCVCECAFACIIRISVAIPSKYT